ncbi:MAG TPA: hypothetical protein VHQ01_01965 [Pyrinomonadaceae bacterium]|nr:hypothetical protein [Pyrinomonadaceae bacterium]
MKTKNTQTLVIALAMILTLAIGPALVFGQDKADNRAPASGNDESSNNLEGVWQTVVTFRDCHTGVAFGSFQALRTIAAGGTMLETNPSFPSSGHGIWKHTTDHQYTVTLAFYAYDPAGAFAGNSKIKEYITLGRNSNSYTSSSTFEFFDPNGNVVDSGCSTESATRFTF